MDTSFVHTFQLCLGSFYGYGFGVYFSAIEGSSISIPEGSPWGQILVN